MGVLSVVLGVLAMLGMIVAFFPCLGALNWINIPFSLIALIIGLLAFNKEAPERRGMAKAGIILSAIAAGLGIIRLVLGGGVL